MASEVSIHHDMNVDQDEPFTLCVNGRPVADITTQNAKALAIQLDNVIRWLEDREPPGDAGNAWSEGAESNGEG